MVSQPRAASANGDGWRPTGDPRADATLRALLAAFESAFPQRIRAWYALGSFADASAIAASDLDIVIVFKQPLDEAERGVTQRMAAAQEAQSEIELDIEISDEQALAAGASPEFKLGSTLLAGEEMRDRAPLISLQSWTRDRMHSSWWRVARLFARPAVIALPLEFPEPADPFRGYTRRAVRLASGERVPSTRDLIRLVGWAATALLALQRGVYVARKRDVGPLYREHIGGEWAPLVEQTYTLCRTRWGYLIPAEASEQARLSALCDQTLGFERCFVTLYREYLLAELASADAEGRRLAADAMSHAPLRDDAVTAALERLARDDDEAIATLAQSALAQIG